MGHCSVLLFSIAMFKGPDGAANATGPVSQFRRLGLV